ncbi:MAG: PPC domain-containing protein, partial [Deltaproteobacteria bacterium]|nr:PPC domain-containing protein [Nannocystaceae bacterium]
SASCGGDFSPDDLYEFTAPNSGLFTFDTFGSELDTVLYVRQAGCDSLELACNDDSDEGETASQLLTGLAAGQTVLIGVDGNGSGAYTLNLAEVPCPDQDLGNVAPQTESGNTTGGFDKLRGSCSSGNPNDESPDVAYSFTAPADGEYVFDTDGSNFNTVLYVLDGASCNANEIACSDNFAGQQSSALSVPMLAGETITVVVDGNFNGSGNYQLNVGVLGGGTCPDVDLGTTVPSSTDGDSSGGDNTVAGTCGGFTQPDDTYLFTAELEGLYIFDTFGSSYDTVLIVRDGCGGAELGCNDDFNFLQQSRVSADLDAGQSVMVAVDGNFDAGAYTLNVQYVTCPDEDIDSSFPFSIDGSTLGLVDKLDSPCPDGDAPDYAFEWTAPADGSYEFDTIGSDYDTVLYLQDLACGGEELVCNDDAFGVASIVNADLVEGQTIIIVVSGFSGNSGAFTLNIS